MNPIEGEHLEAMAKYLEAAKIFDVTHLFVVSSFFFYFFFCQDCDDMEGAKNARDLAAREDALAKSGDMSGQKGWAKKGERTAIFQSK